MSIITSAPGKLFLLGEYAVLHGAPAIIAAVDARAQVRAAPAADGNWWLRAPDIGVPEVLLNVDGGLPPGLAAPTRRALRVFAAARNAAAHLSMPPLAIEIETGKFAVNGNKLGLGASAAVTVALTGAFGLTAGAEFDRSTILAQAVQAHRTAQGGEGSGADIAAATLGGILAVTMDQPPQPIAWPENLYLLAIPTGGGADTPTLVAATRQLAKQQPQRHAQCMATLAAQARRGAQAIAAGDAGPVLAAADAYFDGLDALGTAAGAEIVTATHHRLRTIIKTTGAIFKPTGAGGGDLGIVLTDSTAVRARCAQLLTAAGHAPVKLQFGAAGLRIESQSLH